jgi:small conductance mechanosensitive channel
MPTEGVIKNFLDGLLSDTLSFFWCVLLAIVVYFVGVRIGRLIKKAIISTMEKRQVELGVRQFTSALLTIAIYFVMIVAILNLFGVQTSSVAAAVVSVLMTAGLSLQGALSNFAGGVLILVLHPFVVGDYIKEDTHGNEGTVIEISIFYTRLRTVDEKIVVIPNGVLANSSLTNITSQDIRRIDFRVGISYDDDISLAKKILTEIAKEHKGRIKDRDMQVFVDSLGDSAIIMGLRFYVKQQDYWTIRWGLNEQVKSAFDEAGITIPYGQMDVHLHKEKKETEKKGKK